ACLQAEPLAEAGIAEARRAGGVDRREPTTELLCAGGVEHSRLDPLERQIGIRHLEHARHGQRPDLAQPPQPPRLPPRLARSGVGPRLHERRAPVELHLPRFVYVAATHATRIACGGRQRHRTRPSRIRASSPAQAAWIWSSTVSKPSWAS